MDTEQVPSNALRTQINSLLKKLGKDVKRDNSIAPGFGKFVEDVLGQQLYEDFVSPKAEDGTTNGQPFIPKYSPKLRGDVCILLAVNAVVGLGKFRDAKQFMSEMLGGQHSFTTQALKFALYGEIEIFFETIFAPVMASGNVHLAYLKLRQVDVFDYSFTSQLRS